MSQNLEQIAQTTLDSIDISQVSARIQNITERLAYVKTRFDTPRDLKYPKCESCSMFFELRFEVIAWIASCIVINLIARSIVLEKIN